MNRFNWYKKSYSHRPERLRNALIDGRRAYDRLIVCKICNRVVSLDAYRRYNGVGLDLCKMEYWADEWNKMTSIEATQTEAQDRHYQDHHPTSKRWNSEKWQIHKLPRAK